MICFLVYAQPPSNYDLSKEKFDIENITFRDSVNNANIKGELITPKQSFSHLIILVPGSGKDTRYSHPMLINGLLENNIGVLRIDELGVGESSGKYSPLSTALQGTTKYAFLFLKNKISKNIKIGLIGHSLGGQATMSVYKLYPKDVSFLVQISTPIDSFKNDIIWKIEKNTFNSYVFANKPKTEILSFAKEITDIMFNNREKGFDVVKQLCFKVGKEKKISKYDINTIVNPVYYDIMKYDFTNDYQNISVPLLYIIGSNDNVINWQHQKDILSKINNPNIQYNILTSANHYLTNRDINKINSENFYQIDPEALSIIIKFIKGI